MNVINLHEYEENFEGEWWSPTAPEERRHGRLECVPGKRIELHLTSIGLGIPFHESPAILCGQANNKKITLWNCFQNRTSVSGNEFKARYSVQVVIPGITANGEGDLMFDEAEFSLEHLSDWIGRRSINESRILQDMELRLDLQDDIIFRVSDRIEGSICQSFAMDHPDFYSVKISQHDSIRLKFKEPKALGEIKKEVTSWRWLISLLMGRPVSETRLLVKNENSPYGEPHDVIYTPGRSNAYPTKLHDFDMLCPYGEVHDRFEGIVHEWQRIRSAYPAVLHRYFSTVFKHGLYTHEDFLFLAQAIESYWKTKIGGRPRFRECVEGAFDAMPFFVRNFVGARDEFADHVVNNRNYYTHYDPEIERKGKVIGFNELYELRQKMQFVIEALLLQELGLTESIVGQVIDGQRVRKLIEYQ